MRNITFSVIIPCYNGWKYFFKCLNSLENQTILPNQVIVVDDCSTDNSYEQLLNYSKNSKLNIIVLKNEINSGPSVSRKNGLNYVTSSHVLFCDCDDWYELNTLEKIKNAIISSNADLIIFDNYRIIGDKKEKANVTMRFLNSKKNEIMALYPMSLSRFGVSYDIVKNVVFPPLYNGEDGAVAPQIIEKAKNISVIEDALYNYYFRENSVSMKPSKKAYLGMIEAFRVVKENVSNLYDEEIEFLGVKFVCIAATLSAIKAGIDNKMIRSFISEYKIDYPNWYKNKYIKSLPKSRRVYLLFLRKNHLGICRIICKIHTLMNRGK